LRLESPRFKRHYSFKFFETAISERNSPSEEIAKRGISPTVREGSDLECGD